MSIAESTVMEGPGVPCAELLCRIGKELVGHVTQQYVYNRMITEMKQCKMTWSMRK